MAQKLEASPVTDEIPYGYLKLRDQAMRRPGIGTIRDMNSIITGLFIPVCFFHGIYDYTVSYPLAKNYFEALQAPVKGFYTFQNSAHSPLFEEPQRVKEIFVCDILKGKIDLADN